MSDARTLIKVLTGFGIVLSLTSCSSPGEGGAAVYAGVGNGSSGYESLSYFDALLGYRGVPKMPIRNIFAERDLTERKGPDIVPSKPLVAPLVKPPAATKTVAAGSTNGSMPRLIGIVIREHESKAFFSGKKFYTVAKGDVVAGRFRITAIQPEQVQVFDKRTGSRRTLRMKN